MKNLILKRVLAYSIDCLIIMVYALVLFGTTVSIYSLYDQPLEPVHPIAGSIINLFTLTIPVFLYFVLSEKGKQKGTIGKRLMRIKVDSSGSRAVILRNVFKILPWEIAHIGIHWMVYYEEQGMLTPKWIWILLLVPQLLVVYYFITALLTKGQRSFYDKIANTRISESNV